MLIREDYPMRIYQSISFKIIIILFLAMLLVTLGTTYIHDRTLRNYLEQTMNVCAERTSFLVELALQHGMQENHPEDIRSTINDLGYAESIENIRVYDKSGRIAYASDTESVGTVVDLRSEACYMCHTPEIPYEITERDHYMRVFRVPSGERIMGLITPIRNKRSCWEADCHAHPRDQTVLGVLDVQMSLAETDAQVRQGRSFLIFSALITFVLLAAATWVFVFFVVHKPVRTLIKGTQELSSGRLDYNIPLERGDELGNLVRAFNTMATDLKLAKAELVEWSNTLEEKVERKTAELSSVQSQILHMEKMASLGKLSSMIAHELNNPLAGILTYARLTQKRLGGDDLDEKRLEAMRTDVQLIADEAKRCGDIVKNLLFFARGQSGQYKQADINEIITKSIKLIQHNLDLHEIKLDVTLPETQVLATCEQNQMQQAILALLMNAIEAMSDGGKLGITLSRENSTVVVRISDTGTGISEQDQQRIFEPFFTTKEEGHGTGLGLSIVYGIVRSHEGTITVNSEPGKGSIFTIRIPYSGPTTLQSTQEA